MEVLKPDAEGGLLKRDAEGAVLKEGAEAARGSDSPANSSRPRAGVKVFKSHGRSSCPAQSYGCPRFWNPGSG